MTTLGLLLHKFAHEGEQHGDVLETARHIGELSPWLAVVGVFGVVFIIPALLKRYRPKSAVWLFALLAGLLLTGLFSYSVFPIISTLSIFAGFMIAFLLTIGGLLR